jgi:poly(A) polymerase
VLYRLHESGFSAYLVGGCVRDLLLGYKPKDFDVATDAHPEEVRKIFRNCRLIGKRFRLAHIFFGREIIEVATFRTHHENAEDVHHAKMDAGRIIRDNVYGTIEDDAFRRDFRINALYYNIADFTIVDYTGGMEDIKANTLHMIGDPEKRYHEDPVRMLRAIRFLGKLNINIAPETAAPITRLGYLLTPMSPARLFQEALKIFQEGALANTISLLQKYKLFGALFPQTEATFKHPEAKKLLDIALANTDTRHKEGKTVSPAFLLAVFLWRPTLQKAIEYQHQDIPFYVAFDKALRIVLKKQTEQLSIPRVMQATIREICTLQQRFTFRRGTQPYRLLEHPRFRAGYDLLALRVQAGEPVQELYDWWTQFHLAEHPQREKMLQETQRQLPKKTKKFKRRRKHSAMTPPPASDPIA